MSFEAMTIYGRKLAAKSQNIQTTHYTTTIINCNRTNIYEEGNMGSLIKKWFHPTWLILIILLYILSACKPDPIKEFMQGTWYYTDLHLQQIAAEQHLEATWTFLGNVYETESCCFNGESYERGNFRIVKSNNSTHTLELYNREGHIAGIALDENSSYQIFIVIDEVNDTFKIGRAVYTRQEEP
jgi:hypothetical protein